MMPSFCFYFVKLSQQYFHIICNTVCFIFSQFNFDKTIVDSGTTNLRFPVKVYDAVTELITTQSGVSSIFLFSEP